MIRSTLFTFTILAIFSTSSLSQLTTSATPPSLRDVTMSGTAIWHIGSDNETGTITFKATRDGKSRMDLALGSAQKSEIRINDPVRPKALFFDGTRWQTSALHNSWTDANWFFPPFAATATANERSFTLSQVNNSVRAQFNVAGQEASTASLIRILSITDSALDPATHLLTTTRWAGHPDNDFNVSVPVEVRFSDYRNVGGVEVPFRIERYINGTLQLEITISSIGLNPGLSNNDFTANN